MILAGAVAVVFWLYCGVMGVMARSERPFVQNSLFHAGSVLVYVVLATAVAGLFIRIPNGHPLMTVPAFVMVLIIGVLLGYRYWAYLIGEYMDRLHASATGITTMKVQKTYDVADKADHEGDLDRAMALYAEEAARDPKDPEPLRRMAELHLRRGRAAEAFECFRRALPLVSEPEPKSTLAFRLADLLEREGRGDEARVVLQGVERDLAGSRFAQFARDRLSSLDAQK